MMKNNPYTMPLRIYTPADEDYAHASDVMATALTQGGKEQAYLHLSREELMDFLDRAAAVQDTQTGLLKLCLDDTMPADIRVYLWYNPTYAAALAGIHAFLHYPEAFDESRIKFLQTLLNSCIRRGLTGHGYDSLAHLLENLESFLQAGLREFLDQGAAGAEDFRVFMLDRLQTFQQDIENAKQNGQILQGYMNLQMTPCQGRIERLLAMYNGKPNTVFVYGTLMQNKSASHMMANAIFCDNAALEGYALYDLGGYPGIVPDEKGTVIGEVWFVDNETMARLDTYENEGVLYRRTQVTISSRKGTLLANTYVYLGQVYGTPLWNKWQTSSEDPVWYAGYGSNLSPERFQCYIQGGICQENGAEYPGCTDKTLWSKRVSAVVRGKMYFGNSSSKWNGGGVAFLEPVFGQTICQLYRITWGQFLDVRQQEGESANWYGRVLFLQFGEDGLPVFALTSQKLRRPNRPSDAYLGLLVRALKKEAGLSSQEIARYLWKPLCCENKLLLRDVQAKVDALL